MPVLADDSGLEVAALNNRPGLLSARYAYEKYGRQPSNAEQIATLLDELNLEQTKASRAASFICCLVLYLNKRVIYSVQEELEGYIAHKAPDIDAFAYDPIFMLPNNKSLASLSIGEKNKISHRGRAARRLLRLIDSAV